MKSTSCVLKREISRPEFQNMELLEIFYSGRNRYLIATDWQAGIHIFRIIKNSSGLKLKPVEFECPQARRKNISGLCILPGESKFCVLFNDNRLSGIVEFEFNPVEADLNRILIVSRTYKLNLNSYVQYYDLKLLSAYRCELAFLDRTHLAAKRKKNFFIFNYDTWEIRAALDYEQILKEKGFGQPGLRSFEILQEKYLFLPDYEFMSKNRLVGSNQVHVFKIGYTNQTYSLSYLKSFGRELFKCPFFIRKSSSSNDNLYKISVLDWRADCLFEFRFDSRSEEIKHLGKKTFETNFESKVEQIEKSLYPVAFCQIDKTILLSRLLHRPFCTYHKHYNGHDKLYAFGLSEKERTCWRKKKSNSEKTNDQTMSRL